MSSVAYIDENYERKYLALLKKIIIKIFNTPDCEVFLFGSRTTNNYRRDSDYDIGVMNINKKEFVLKKMELEEIVEESIIPHKVDIVYFDEVDDVFRKNAMKNRLLWKN